MTRSQQRGLTMFKPGQSGNPRGRPPTKRRSAAEKYLGLTENAVTANTWLKLIHRLIDIGANSKSEKSSVDAIKTLASFLMPRDPVHFLQLIQQQPMTLDEIRARHRELQNMRETMMSLVEGPKVIDATPKQTEDVPESEQ